MPQFPQLLTRLADQHGTPCYVYFLDQIQERIESLRRATGGRFNLSYAVKCNPHDTILRFFSDRITHLDVSSAGELRRALQAGWSPARLSFTGPGKTTGELEAAIRSKIGAVVVESVDEAAALAQLASDAGVIQPIWLRLNPERVPRGFGLAMGGRPTQFGIDAAEIEHAIPLISAMKSLLIEGLHIYSGSQCLSSDGIVENLALCAELFRRAASLHAARIDTIVFGGGFGIPYHAGSRALDIDAVGRGAAEVLDGLAADALLSGAMPVLELGRYLVGEAGIYLTRVVRVKETRGARIAICDGGMNHHLAACGHFGSVIHRNYRMFRIGSSGQADDAPTVVQQLVGPLCTTIDTLGIDVELPRLESGDLVAIQCSGAYGATASPTGFISHDPPREICVNRAGDDWIVVE